MLKSAGLSWRHPTTWAVAAPLICAVHCIVTPLLILALPALAPAESVERGILVGSALLAGLSLRTSLPVHRDRRVLAPVGLGLGVWAVSELHILPEAFHAVWTTIGSLLLALGLFWSARLRHRVTCRCNS